MRLVILLFFLLVTPEIRSTGVPLALAGVLFLFPIIFLLLLFTARYRERPTTLAVYLGVTLVIGLWAYSGLAFNADPLGILYMDPNLLNIFVSVVFVNSPTVFRIGRGLTIDIKTRDYVAAAQTRTYLRPSCCLEALRTAVMTLPTLQPKCEASSWTCTLRYQKGSYLSTLIMSRLNCL